MKKLFSFIVLVSFLSTTTPVYAHSGRTDSDGGHEGAKATENRFHEENLLQLKINYERALLDVEPICSYE